MGERSIERDEQTLGVYVSVPFCRAKCTYCNFASGVHGIEQHARYVERVCAELGGTELRGTELRSAERSPAARLGAVVPGTIGSVYLGGGTPNLLAPELLQRIFDELR